MADTVFLPATRGLTSSFDSERGVRSLRGQKPSGLEKDRRDLEQACGELESLFISYLLKEMRAAIPKSGLITGGPAEEMYTSMLDSQLARELAFKGGLGLADMLMNQLGVKPEHAEIREQKK